MKINVRQIAKKLGADNVEYSHDNFCYGRIEFNADGEVIEQYFITYNRYIIYRIIYTIGDTEYRTPGIPINMPIELWINTFRRGLFKKASFWKYAAKSLMKDIKHAENVYKEFDTVTSYSGIIFCLDEYEDFKSAREYFKMYNEVYN